MFKVIYKQSFLDLKKFKIIIFLDFSALRLFPKLFPPGLLRISPPNSESSNHSALNRFSGPPLFGMHRPLSLSSPLSHSSLPHSLSSALGSPSMAANAWNAFPLQVQSAKILLLPPKCD